MQEEESRLLVQHVAVDSSHVDVVRSQRLDHRIYFVIGKNEVTGNSRLAAASRLEVDRDGHAHRANRSNWHSAFHDRIAPRYIKLVDAAIGLPFAADDLIKLRRVEIDRGWSSGCGWRREGSLACCPGIMNNGRHLGWVAVAAPMQRECRGGRPQPVIVGGP